MAVNCDYCQRPAELVTGDVIYPHRADLFHKRFWHCPPCGAYVGVHAGSKDHKPLGRLANKELRDAKQAAHAAFDPLWKSGEFSRSGAYKWLSARMKLPASETHIGMFNVEQCRRVVELCESRGFEPVELIDVHLDFESFSEAPLGGTKGVGAYVYANHPSTEVLCCAYAFGDEKPRLWLPGYSEEPEFTRHPERYRFHAHNAQFEVWMWKFKLQNRWGEVPPLEQWVCTAATAAALALPRALKNACQAMNLPAELQKDKRGEYLIQRLCKPWKGKRVRDPALLQELYDYCVQDVVAERALGKKMLPLSEAEQAVWRLDQVINERGIPVDTESCRHAVALYEEHSAVLTERLKELTGVDNPSSTVQLHAWLEAQGWPLTDLQASTVREMCIDNGACPPHVREAMAVRLQLAKTPPKKYYKLLALAAVDERAHGTMLYHGAQPGRWSGRDIQPHNMMRPVFDDTDACIELYPHRSVALVEALYDDCMDALASTVRGMIKASPGCRLMAGDYSAIEARLVPWQAGQEDVLDVFRGDGRVYERQAAKIFHIDEADVVKAQRQIGKVAILACGFEGGYAAFIAMGKTYGIDIEKAAADATPAQRREMVGIKEWWASLDEPRFLTDGEAFADLIKREWRASNAKVVAYWHNVLEAALGATENPNTTYRVNRIAYRRVGSTLFCRLPSGRMICYHNPRKGRNRWGKDVLRFVGVDDRGNWSPQTTHGGKLVQNITEGIGRDLLVHSLFNLERANYRPFMHVHDEVVCEVPNGFGSLDEFKELLIDAPEWAEGLPVDGDVYEAQRYRKD